ncbi:PREDICTED: phosphatidylinositol N-acetylglucosaminyltransferase subunit C-like isoform X1 [Acropora digitifera]|uniref:phosphatidylinositol N-acetylglucosaminyltransferase subunit C-like isoform X1 n=1 Tax=Acropora digitifera TaxID=70779 RepID=UPI00077A2E88|nr:PREDICTED: phosphatidylinositol N-acetylglucosaminyltransferase subunit C-like isoform X1 [Acropora digitifera]
MASNNVKCNENLPDEIKRRTVWRKVLYKDQGVPDNYVDESFLDEMRKNLYTRTYQFWSVVLESGAVSQQISSVAIFVAVFVYMDLGALTPSALFVFASVLTFIGYILFDALDGATLRLQSGRTRLDDLKSCLLVLMSVFVLSPVLKTLTDSISTDTIYAMTTFMLAMNLLLYDYGTRAAIVSRSASLNASIFASVCLASRLPSSWHVFATVAFAMQLFALFPSLRRQLKMHLPSSDKFVTWVLVLVAIAMLWPLSQLFAVLLVLVHLAVTFVCPFWLIKLQGLKK